MSALHPAAQSLFIHKCVSNLLQFMLRLDLSMYCTVYDVTSVGQTELHQSSGCVAFCCTSSLRACCTLVYCRLEKCSCSCSLCCNELQLGCNELLSVLH